MEFEWPSSSLSSSQTHLPASQAVLVVFPLSMIIAEGSMGVRTHLYLSLPSPLHITADNVSWCYWMFWAIPSYVLGLGGRAGEVGDSLSSSFLENVICGFIPA